MLRKIKLYGPLRKLSGVKEFKADVSNVDQVFSFIKVNYPDTKQHLTESFYSVHMNDIDITYKNLVIQGEGDIKVIPLINGNFDPFSLIATFFVAWIDNTIANAIFATLVMGGLQVLSDILAPVPIEPAVDPQVESFLTNQNANTTKAGGAAPLVFGECLVGSVVISAGADTVQVADSA